MPNQHFCAHCDEAFTPADDKARCPTCMRKGAVLSEPEPKGRSASLISPRGIALVMTVAVLGAVGFGFYRSRAPSLEPTAPLRPLSDRELAAYLERDQVDVGTYGSMLALSTDMEGVPADTDDLTSLLRARTSSWSLEQPLPREVWTADATLAKLRSEGSRERVYPLEVAAGLTALLRRRGVAAMVADVGEFEGQGTPADPSGMLGYYVVALYEDGSEGPSRFLDPWGGHTDSPTDTVRVLRDTEVIGAALGIEATRAFVRTGDATVALPIVENALRLDPMSPSLRVTHAVILAESGGVPQALQELEAALQLRSDGSRKLHEVQLTLAQGAMLQASGRPDMAEVAFAEANRALTGILEQWPRYGRAHLTMATMYLGMGQLDRARVELERAQSLGLDSPMLLAVWAQYHAANEEPVEAAARMRRAVELDPENWQLRAQAAAVFQEIGDTERSREHAEATLRLVPDERRQQLRAYFEQVGVFDSVSGGTADLELPEPTMGTAPGTTGESAGPALKLGDPSDLRLREPGQKLELDLDD